MNAAAQVTHTPGPWTLEDDGWVYGPHGEAICDPHSDNRDLDEREATAILIAAAPRLLEACKSAANAFRAYMLWHRAKGTHESAAKADTNERLLLEMLDAIASATGAQA